MTKDTTSTTGESTDIRADGGTAEADSAQEEGLFPVDGRWFEIGFYFFLFTWLGYMMYETLGYSNEMDWLFPLFIGTPLTILLLIQLASFKFPQLVDLVMPNTKSTQDDEMFEAVQEVGARKSKAEKEKYELVMIGWVILLPFMMYVVGMGWTLIGYTFGFTWYFTRNIRTSAMITVIVIIFVWVLFIEILGLLVWNGILGLPAPLETLVRMRG